MLGPLLSVKLVLCHLLPKAPLIGHLLKQSYILQNRDREEEELRRNRKRERERRNERGRERESERERKEHFLY